MLGVRFSPEYLEALRRTATAQAPRRRHVACESEADVEAVSNHEFAYIAGYTEGGVPFGVKWEEMDGLNPQQRAVHRRRVPRGRITTGRGQSHGR